jgi:uncharacterized membrane protein YfhO
MADKQRNIDTLFDQNFNERKNATIEEAVLADKKLHIGKSTIASYEANQVIVKTENSGDGFLILTDVYYPTWHVQIDGMESRVYRADYVLRGVFIPKGNHTIRFYDTIF